MATVSQWVAGARPRTLPAALAPVAVGSGVAAFEHSFSPGIAALALVLALALQIGVNYANDYSDGVRGTDSDRVGPVRLVGQSLAPPGAVKAAAVTAFALGAGAGLALVVASGVWWLLIVGVACLAAGWLYTGGPRPYGYAGLGEVFVFVFFGLVAVAGSATAQTGRLTFLAIVAAIPPGLWACAILLANNLRDIPGDTDSGKRTLAVRLGDRRTRQVYSAVVVTGFLVVGAMVVYTPWVLLAAVAIPLAVRPISAVTAGARGRELIAVLSGTSVLLLVAGVLLGVGLALGG